VKSNLGDKGRADVARILGLQDGAFEGLLSSKIEAAVHDLQPSAPPPSAAASGGASAPALTAA
jgi:hypothetical protein